MSIKTPAFSPALRRKLAYGKYTLWAVDLDEDTLKFLIHLIGEYACRTHNWKPLQELMEANVEELKKHKNFGFIRLILALKTIQRIYYGEGINAMTDWTLDLTKATSATPIKLRKQDISATTPCPHCGKPLI